MAFSDVLGGAGTGAAAGAFVGGPVGAVVGGLAGGLIGLFSGNAAEDAAQAQENVAMAQLEEARRAREFALGRAAASESELELQRALTGMRRQALGQGERELQFLQAGLDMRQPGAYEQGAGLFSSVLLRSRQVDRSKLESSLRSRLGAGYATSSIGQMALQQFDMATADLATSMIPKVLQSQYMAIGQEASLQDIIKKREITASIQTPITQYAGAQFAGDILNAQREQQNFSSLLRLGGTVAGTLWGEKKFGTSSGALAGAQIGSQVGGGSSWGQVAQDLTTPRVNFGFLYE